MLMDNEVALPLSGEEFRGYIEGYSVARDAFLGSHNQILNNYKAQVVDFQNKIISLIEQFYRRDEDHCLAWAVVLMYIYRNFNDYFTQTLAGEVPIVTGAPAPRALTSAPDFGVIKQKLVLGTLLSLTLLPPTFYDQAPANKPAPHAPHVPLPPARAPLVGENLTRGRVRAPGRENCQAVCLPHQNLNLEAAWAAKGLTRLYAPPSPFHNPAQHDGCLLVSSDTPDLSHHHFSEEVFHQKNQATEKNAELK